MPGVTQLPDIDQIVLCGSVIPDYRGSAKVDYSQ
jgi:hypothetical protein